jgi:hypothetical protein
MKRAKQISHSSLSEFVDLTATVPAIIFLNYPFSVSLTQKSGPNKKFELRSVIYGKNYLRVRIGYGDDYTLR